MAYIPEYTITPLLLSHVERIAALRERILSAPVSLAWIPGLQKDTRSRNVHASTAIEGNPLTLEQVRALEEGRELANPGERSRREVLNYFAGLRHIEKRASQSPGLRIVHEDIFELHRILAKGVMDQGTAGRYRSINVQVGTYRPPAHEKVSGYMFELLEWWNKESGKLSPILSSAILHHRFETIHPFADGNGRTGRALALWDLYKRGFDTHHIFSVDEFYREDRARYYKELDAVRRAGDDLSGWLEYSAEGLAQTLERVWIRIQAFSTDSGTKLELRPAQQRLLNLLRDSHGMAPAELWHAMNMSRQGVMGLLNPLLDAGIVVREGGKKSGRYNLASSSRPNAS